MRHKYERVIAKRLALLCTVCLSILFSPSMPTVEAQGAAKLSASAVEVNDKKGRSAEIALTLEENPGLWGMRVRITFDPSVLTLVSVESGGLFGQDDIFLPENRGSGGQMIFLAVTDQLKDTAANGTLATLQFNVSDKAPAGICPVTVEVLEAINFAGARCEVGTADGSVKVKAQTAQTEETGNAEAEKQAQEQASKQDTSSADGASEAPGEASPEQPPQMEVGGPAVSVPEESGGFPILPIVAAGVASVGAAGGIACWRILLKKGFFRTK